MLRKTEKKCFGIIGGLGALAGADLFFKLVKATPARNGSEQVDIVFEQHRYDEPEPAGSERANLNGRKLYIFDMIRQFEQRKVGAIIVPCFVSHTFIDELQAEVKLPIVNLMQALRCHLERRHPDQRRIGVLASTHVRSKGLFERYFEAGAYSVLYPRPPLEDDCLMPAIYGPQGIKSGHVQGTAVDLLHRACQDLLEQGAQIIVPGATEISVVIDALRARGMPVVDVNQVYAQYAIDGPDQLPARTFKIGVVGGVGPAATVDFMNKIVRNTDASRDQEHVKLLVEHNPQIPDRTGNLLADGPDPTVALYSACKKLEAGDADLIAIPCNTAHAFVERIQPYLSIPIVNMLQETVDYVERHFGGHGPVGLLATSGTISSRVYHDVAGRAGWEMMVPDAQHQAMVMEAIYGEHGVKAGHVEGPCKKNLLAALAHLAQRGARVVLLGCTELPLLLAQCEDFQIAGTSVALLDPTEILARKCVALSGRGRHPQ